MRRLALLPLLALAAIPLTVATASGAPPRAELTEFLCHRGVAAIDRVISVRAVMRPVNGTQRMQVRFQLLTTTPRRGAVSIPGGDLGAWLSPTDPSTLGQSPNDVWIISHPVYQLRAPGSYHFRVSFRWLGANDRILSSETHVGPACFQPDLRPDLSVAEVTATEVSSTQTRYVALIRNTGATAAVGPFQVGLYTHGNLAAPAVTIRRLGSHASRTVTLVGPPCGAASAPTVIVDPAHVVPDLNPANNSLQVICPASAVPSAPLHSTQR